MDYSEKHGGPIASFKETVNAMKTMTVLLAGCRRSEQVRKKCDRDDERPIRQLPARTRIAVNVVLISEIVICAPDGGEAAIEIAEANRYLIAAN
jgi:hypothetical protein